MNNYKVAIVGCGSIGSSKPDHIDYLGSPNILTHSNAVCSHSRTELVAFVDTDTKKSLSACEKWDVKAMYPAIEPMMIECKPDIVIIATPTNTHYKILSETLNYQPRLIIAEKPFCLDSIEANDIIHQQKGETKDGRHRIPIMVDYIRRFAKGYQEIKKQIDSGKFGKALNCRVLYTRGLKHEGCHAVDLMRYFFEKCIEFNIDKSAPLIIDRDQTDPGITVNFKFEKCNSISFIPLDARNYKVFEIDIFFEKCRVRFIDNGFYYEMYPIIEQGESEWSVHKFLNYRLTDVTRKETFLNVALYNLIDNAVNYLDGKEDLTCTVKDAIAVHEILEGV